MAKEETLIADVLNKAHLAALPKTARKNVIWIEAIAKMRLSNRSIGYAILKRNEDLSYRTAYINGETFPYVEIEEVYPYIVLDKGYIRKFGKNDKEKARIAYLRSLHLPYESTLDLDSMSISELDKEIVRAAVYRQLQALKEE